MTRTVAQPRACIAAFPRLRLTPQAFARLPEYSCSYPTGTKPGKMWKRLDGSHDRAFLEAGGQPYWVVMQYNPAAPSDEEVDAMRARGEPIPNIAILRFKPVITIRAATRPHDEARAA